MQIELLSFAASSAVDSLQSSVQHMGRHDVRRVRRWSDRSASENIRVLYVQDDERDDPGLSSLIAQGEPIHLVLTDSREFLTAPGMRHRALDVCMWPNTDAELQMRLDRLRCAWAAPGVDPALAEVCLRVNLIGDSTPFLEALAAIRRYANTDANLLILGETGTGKELAARATHYLGRRHDGPFQAVNCGAIPEHLVENELFGHSRGAYTDARSAQPGLIELAAGGTLFLDEVDSLPFKAQTALLRFLEDRRYRPLGAALDRRADVRIIAASNVDLARAVEQGRFRKDLYYRLHLLSVELPALRERREDIPRLAAHFLEQCAAEYQQGRKVFHPHALDELQNGNWPGNARELEHYVHRAYLSTSAVTIECREPRACTSSPVHEPTDRPGTAAFAPFGAAKQRAIDEFEHAYLSLLMSSTGGNVSRAAEIAGKERRALGKLLKKHGIDRHAFRDR